MHKQNIIMSKEELLKLVFLISHNIAEARAYRILLEDRQIIDSQPKIKYDEVCVYARCVRKNANDVVCGSFLNECENVVCWEHEPPTQDEIQLANEKLHQEFELQRSKIQEKENSTQAEIVRKVQSWTEKLNEANTKVSMYCNKLKSLDSDVYMALQKLEDEKEILIQKRWEEQKQKKRFRSYGVHEWVRTVGL
jgi:hypothetical protein